MADLSVTVIGRRIDVMPMLPPQWTVAEEVAAWIQRQQLPEGLRRRGLESISRSLLTTLWWHFIDDLSEGIRMTEHNDCRMIQFGRVFQYYVNPDAGTIHFCHIDPNCGARWCSMDVMHPVAARFWVERVLHRQCHLMNGIEEQLVACGWKNYPDCGEQIDLDAASQVAMSVWAWCARIIIRRVRHARVVVPINRQIMKLLDLDPDMVQIALRAHSGVAERRVLSNWYWNTCSAYRQYFKPIMRYLPEAVPALGAYIQGRSFDDCKPIAVMLERIALMQVGASHQSA